MDTPFYTAQNISIPMAGYLIGKRGDFHIPCIRLPIHKLKRVTSSPSIIYYC